MVLGGSVDSDLSVAHPVPVVRAAADRIIAAAALARRYSERAHPVYRRQREFDLERRAGGRLCRGDFRESRDRKVAADHRAASRNTYENAVFSKALVAPKPGEHWMLVTSAYHMPRSVGLFRKVGFAVEPYPVDWRIGGREDLLSFPVCPVKASPEPTRRCANGSASSPIG